MGQIISIVGKSGAGKTRLLERLIGELKQRGYKIAAVKHMRHDFEIDHQGKDSWRLMQAGADSVVLSSPVRLASVTSVDSEPTLEELRRFIGADFDLVIIEGFKKSPAPKIEVYRKELGADLVCTPEQLLAIVSDEILDIPLPRFTPDDIKGLADFIEQRFPVGREENIALFVNDKFVPLGSSVKETLISDLTGLVSDLSGIGEIKKLDIWLRRPEG